MSGWRDLMAPHLFLRGILPKHSIEPKLAGGVTGTGCLQYHLSGTAVGVHDVFPFVRHFLLTQGPAAKHHSHTLSARAGAGRSPSRSGASDLCRACLQKDRIRTLRPKGSCLTYAVWIESNGTSEIFKSYRSN